MDIRKKIKITLISAALLILLGSIVLTVYLFFSNYQNVQLLQQAESNFKSGDTESLKLAESQLLTLVRNDPDNEQAFIILGKIAGQKKIYPELVYYTCQAHKLNPLSEANERAYVESLLYAREFGRLENFLSQKSSLDSKESTYLLYASGQNGNIRKYPKLLKHRSDDLIAETALLLFEYNHLSDEKKIFTLENFLNRAKDDFQKQEIFSAISRLYLKKNDFDNAEKYLLKAYKLNEFAFAPALGRFYANYRAMGKALEIFEKYLAIYHDPEIAMQSAELCCLLKKRDKIAALKKSYQSDPGKGAMLLNYYFDVLDKFASGDIDALRQYLPPLQKSVNTPLATFIYFCSELEKGDLTGILKYYTALLNHRMYLDLQSRADMLVIDLIRSNLKKSSGKDVILQELAEKVYWRKPDAVVGKSLLLAQRQNNRFNLLLLTDLQKRFPDDAGVNKIAVEYNLAHNLNEAEKIIDRYVRKHPQRKKDMLIYKIILAIRQKNYDQASLLFRENFIPELANLYWSFAVNGKRLDDLRFLARNEEYKPFCEAAILLAENKKEQALDILAKVDRCNNQTLLFFGARTLAENDRLTDSLNLYSKFPENSVYKLDIMLNCSELHWVLGNHAESLRLARLAYKTAPAIRAVQYCYADKLYKSNSLAEIADVIKPSSVPSPFDDALQKYEIASLEYLLKNCDLNRDGPKAFDLTERLLRIAPDNKTALLYRKLLQEKLQR